MGVLHCDVEKVLYNEDVIAEAVAQLGKYDFSADCETSETFLSKFPTAGNLRKTMQKRRLLC